MKRTTVVAVAIVSTLTLALAGCSSSGSGDDTTAGGTAAPTGTASSGGGDGDGAPAAASWPVTVDHRYGSTTVAQRPERIVSLDNQWTDVLVALDAPLAGAALDPMAEG